MRKKAVTMAFVVIAMLVIMLTALLIFYIHTVFTKAEQTIPEKTCQTTAEREAQLNLMTGEAYSARDFAANVECKWIHVKTDNKKYHAFRTRQYMQKCWDMLGQGRNLFSSGKFCHICYIITYEPEADFNLEADLRTKPPEALKYDVPEKITGRQYAVIFYQSQEGAAESKIVVREFDPENPSGFEECRNAEFPSQRIA